MEHVSNPNNVDTAPVAPQTSPERKKFDFTSQIADARDGILSVLDDMNHE